MNEQLVYVLLFLVLFLVLVVTTHGLYVFFKMPAEHSRKFLHVSGGILALFAPLFIQSHWWILCLCSVAFLLLLFTYLNHLLPSVHKTTRKSIGSVIFPIPLYLCFLAAQNMKNNFVFYIPISFLTVSDTVAEWGGKKWGDYTKKLMYNKKTVAGSLSFAVCSLLLVIVWGFIFHLTSEQILLVGLTTTIVATLAELVSPYGLDNFTVPVVTLICLIVLRNFLKPQ